MSRTVSDREFSAFLAPRVLRARPLGNLAASMIGVVALFILAAHSLSYAWKAPIEDAPFPPSSAPVAVAASSEDVTGTIPSAKEKETAKQWAIFDLSAPEFANERKTRSQSRQGGGREDALTFGEFDGGRYYLRLDVRQPGGEKLGNSDFFLDMARHAAQAGLVVVRIGQPGPLGSRFGSFESADIRLAHGAGEGAPFSATERTCLAVRLVDSKPLLEIAGIACGATGNPIDRRAMACILDRLEFSSDGDNKAMEQFFLKAELERAQRRLGCDGSSSLAKSNGLDVRPHPPTLGRARSTLPRRALYPP